ncbi:MAG: hypothetical protein CMJ75_04115 [Planctomycetaceae bacterium]|nr:hypothetical protein [Planctomycetaceae bacterium]
MSEEQTVDELITTLRRAKEKKIDKIEEKLKNELGLAEETYQTELEEIDKNLMNQVDSLMNNHNDELGENVDYFQRMLLELRGAAYHWDDEFWHNFSPGSDNDIADCHRVGTLKINGHFNQLETLALVPVINGQNVIFLSSIEVRKQISQAFQSLILRLIVTSPSGKIRLVPIDPLQDNSDIFSIFPTPNTETFNIEDNLSRISQHLSLVRKAYLTEDCPTLVEVMNETGYYPVPHHILAVANFPHTFSEKSIRQLMTIMQKGPSCGIHTIMLVDAEKLPELDLEGLDRQANVISYEEDRFVFLNGMARSNPSSNDTFDYSNFDLELDQLPRLSLIEELMKKTDNSVFDSFDFQS